MSSTLPTMTVTPSTFPSFESASPTTSATSVSSGSSNNSMQKGANYFFGFLITFIALLLIFVGFGVGTRRRFLTRSALADDFRREYEVPVPVKEPSFIEPWLGKGGDTWSSIMPLSTTAIRPRSKSKSTPVSTLNPIPSPFPARFRRLITRPRWPSRQPQSHDEDDDKEALIPDPDDPPKLLQVTVMIAMPSPIKHDSLGPPGSEEPLPEYSFGVTQVDWRGKRLSS